MGLTAVKGNVGYSTLYFFRPTKVDRIIYLFPKRLLVKRLKLVEECELKMADDSTVPITYYVVFPFLVGGIFLIIRAFMVGINESFDILFGKG